MNISRRELIKYTGGGLAIYLGLNVLGCAGKQKTVTLDFGSGPPDSAAFAMGSSLGSISQEKGGGIIINPKAIKTVTAIAKLGKGELHLAEAATLVVYNAIKGEGSFKEPVEHTPIQLMSWYWIAIATFTPVNSDIHTIYDLEGKRVAPGPLAASYVQVYKRALEASGVNINNIEWVDLETAEMSAALKSGSVDVAGGPANINGIIPSYQKELIAANEVRMVGVPDDAIKKIQQAPGVSGKWFSNEIFGGVKEFPTEGKSFVITSPYVMVANDLVSEDIGKRMLEFIWSIKDDLPNYHKAFKPWVDPSFWTENLDPSIPVHPGAAKFYKEKNLWKEGFTVGKL